MVNGWLLAYAESTLVNKGNPLECIAIMDNANIAHQINLLCGRRPLNDSSKPW